jgi:hypothetical protein
MGNPPEDSAGWWYKTLLCHSCNGTRRHGTHIVSWVSGCKPPQAATQGRVLPSPSHPPAALCRSAQRSAWCLSALLGSGRGTPAPQTCQLACVCVGGGGGEGGKRQGRTSDSHGQDSEACRKARGGNRKTVAAYCQCARLLLLLLQLLMGPAAHCGHRQHGHVVMTNRHPHAAVCLYGPERDRGTPHSGHCKAATQTHYVQPYVQPAGC